MSAPAVDVPVPVLVSLAHASAGDAAAVADVAGKQLMPLLRSAASAAAPAAVAPAAVATWTVDTFD